MYPLPMLNLYSWSVKAWLIGGSSRKQKKWLILVQMVPKYYQKTGEDIEKYHIQLYCGKKTMLHIHNFVNFVKKIYTEIIFKIHIKYLLALFVTVIRSKALIIAT